MYSSEAMLAVIKVLREVTILPQGAEREALLRQLAENPALQVLVAQEEAVALTLQGYSFVT